MFELIGIAFSVICGLVGLSLVVIWSLARYEETVYWLMPKAYHGLMFGMSDDKFNMFLNRLKDIREQHLKTNNIDTKG